MAELEFLLGLIGAVPLVIYAINRIFYTPKLFFRIGGEQTSNVIKVLKEGKIQFAVGSYASFRVKLHKVCVQADPFELTLKETKGANMQTQDGHYSLALCFGNNGNERIVKDLNMHAFFINYKAPVSPFKLRFKAWAKVEEGSLPPLIDMIYPKEYAYERIVLFEVVEDIGSSDKHGLRLKPKEGICVTGRQSEETVSAVADKEGAQLRVLEINCTGKDIYN